MFLKLQTTARTSEVVSILPNSQVAYNNDLKISVTSSQFASEAIRFNSLLNEKSVDVIASAMCGYGLWKH